ncbi:MAG: tRNA pseudouridine(38-40) synthase TruA [Eubacterium sp.]|nr:tRNA pseudouridine(38-40) synthase TruA [Eubacterium sp.]
MKRYRLKVAYDGTNYCGWQVQPNEVTIEGVLNETLSDLLNEDIEVVGASRTDSGVHSDGNYCIFDTETHIPAPKIAYALNQRLPEDISIVKSDEVDEDWHPRYQNSMKTYQYTIINRDMPDPVRRLYTYFTYSKLDVDKMKEAAGFLVGEHDFAAFCSTGSQVENTVRTIESLEVTQNGDEIAIIAKGNGFLYNMVRIIAGTLLEVGEGKLEPSDMEDIIASKDRGKAGKTAVARGLRLVEIKYENE